MIVGQARNANARGAPAQGLNATANAGTAAAAGWDVADYDGGADARSALASAVAGRGPTGAWQHDDAV